MDESKNVILELTFNFALKIIEYSELLEAQRKFTMANQLYRCGTAIGSHASEAQSAESKADFIHKFKIPDKEAEEAIYRLRLCKHSKNYLLAMDFLRRYLLLKK